MTMTVSQAARSSSTPLSAAARRRVPSKRNGVVTIPTVSAPSSRAIARDDRCGAGAGAASLARGDEDHVRAAQRRLQLVDRLLGRRAPDRRIGARAEAVGQTLADRDLRRRVRDRERLPVGVHGDEVDLRDPGVHHAVDRVQAGAADPDDADRGDVRGALRRRHAMELRRRLEHRLEVAGGGARGSGLGRDLLLGRHAGAASETGGSARAAPWRSRGRARRSRRARPRARGSASGCGRRLGARPPRPASAARPRSCGRARRAGPHASSRACAPSSTSFARSRYAWAAGPDGSYLSTEFPFTGASA